MQRLQCSCEQQPINPVQCLQNQPDHTLCIIAQSTHVALNKSQAEDEIFNLFPPRQPFCGTHLKWRTALFELDAVSLLKRLPLSYDEQEICIMLDFSEEE